MKYLVELLLEDGPATALAVKIEKDPVLPHCTVLHLCSPATRITGDAAFQFREISVPTDRIRGWYRGEEMESQDDSLPTRPPTPTSKEGT